jgi:hypothetical protein
MELRGVGVGMVECESGIPSEGGSGVSTHTLSPLAKIASFNKFVLITFLIEHPYCSYLYSQLPVRWVNKKPFFGG